MVIPTTRAALVRTTIQVIVFSVAMGFLESAVVVYLRKIYYPAGFRFPLTPIDPLIATTEFWREVATIIMLSGIGVIAGKNRMQRFAYFVLSFAVWDIFYYVFLKVILGWPATIIDWDILFLIPVPWVGPVICPVIISITMTLFSLSILHFESAGNATFISPREKIIFLAGCAIVLFSFMQDYFTFLGSHHAFSRLWVPGSKEELFKELSAYTPEKFSWWLFWSGELLILLGIARFTKKYFRSQKGTFA